MRPERVIALFLWLILYIRMVELSPAQIKRRYRDWQQVEETFRLLKQEFGWGGSSTRKAEAQTTHLHLGLMAICLTQQALSLRSRRSIPSSVGDFVSRSRTNSRSWNTSLLLRNFSNQMKYYPKSVNLDPGEKTLSKLRELFGMYSICFFSERMN